MRVLVAGGGVAGVAAAVSASKLGASVTIAEGSGRLALDRCLLPRLLREGQEPDDLVYSDPDELSGRYGIDVKIGEQVLAADVVARSAKTGSGRITFDVLVLATGSQGRQDEIRGASKPGVFVLNSVEDYTSLSEALDNLTSVAVVGALPTSLVVAEAMADRSQVSAFLGGAVRSKFTQGVLEEISSAARSLGVQIIGERVDAVMGVKHAEAVLFGGSVHPCDGVVIVPRRSSSVPAVECVRGEHGGAVVDESMRTSSRGVYAAGDCAEIKFGSGSLPSRLHSSSLAMGNVSGVNAAGGSARASISRCISLKLFGVEMCSAGVDADAARKVGLDAVEFASDKSEDGFSTSLVYDRATHQVYGAQVSGRGALTLSDYVSLVVSSRASLDDLAFQESPHLPWLRRGPCPISLTAGRAIAQLGA